MQRIKIILISLVVFGIIVGILFYNKSRTEAKSKTDVLTSVPVSVTTVTRQKLDFAHTLVGTIVANNDVAIVAETQGKVTAVMADVGQHVAAGSAIIQIDDEIKRANFAAAEVNFEKAKKDLERFESLQKENAATDQQIETVRFACKLAEAQFVLARRQYRDTKVTTPIAGIVTARTVDIGSMVLDKMVVANVVDISKLKVKISVSEQDVFRLKPGDAVEVTTDVYPGVKFPGKIRTISSKADDSHTYPVEITCSNSKENPLKAGMFGSVLFQSTDDQEVLVIPREALIGSTREPRVYVVAGAVARRRTITIGSEIGTFLAVIAGLKEGESVVIAGQNNLKDGTAITIVK